MSTTFVEFATRALAEAAVLETDFGGRAKQVATRYNVPLNIPTLPKLKDDALFKGKQFDAAAAGLGNVLPPSLRGRRPDIASLASSEYADTVRKGKQFFDRWFGTPSADQLLADALSKLEGGTVSGLMDEYIALNQQEANEIRHRLMLAHHRAEDEIVGAGVAINSPRMPGAVFHKISLLKEQTHEAIRDELRKLGGEGLQRELNLVMGLVEERLRLNHEAKRTLARWVGAIDDPLNAAKLADDDAALRGAAGVAEQLQAIAQQAASFDQRGVSLAATSLAAKRDIAMAPVQGRLDLNKLQLDAMISELQAISVELAGTYNRLRASFDASWSDSTTKRIQREDI